MSTVGGTPESLVVRQHERLRCDLRATLVVAPESAERVVLALEGPKRGGGDGSEVEVRITDCSRGGLGLQSPVFLPKRCRVRVRVVGVGGIDGPGGVVEVTTVVQRAAMLDRGPTYYLGTAAGAGDSGTARLVAWAQELAAAESRRKVAASGETGVARA
jgi:hypothetical protein